MIVSQRGPGDAIDSDGYHGTLELDSKAVGRGKFKAEECTINWLTETGKSLSIHYKDVQSAAVRIEPDGGKSLMLFVSTSPECLASAIDAEVELSDSESDEDGDFDVTTCLKLHADDPGVIQSLYEAVSQGLTRFSEPELSDDSDVEGENADDDEMYEDADEEPYGEENGIEDEHQE